MAFTVKWKGVPPFSDSIIYADAAGADFTLSPGVSPSSGTFYCRANFSGEFPTEGNLTLDDGTTNVIFRVKAVDGRIERTTSSRSVPVTFVDRRWLWKYGSISGRYNQADGKGRLPQDDGSGSADPTTYDGGPTLNAQELAKLCLEAMGEIDVSKVDFASNPDKLTTTAYVDAIPTDMYPVIKWESENPGKALQELLGEVGCLIALGYDTVEDDNNDDGINIARCHLLSDTSPELPEGNYETYDSGDKSADRPSKIIIVGGRIVLEEKFDTFETVGLDTDGKTKLLADLSYAPEDPQKDGHVLSWDDYVGDFATILEYPAREVALDSIYKWFRVRFDPDDETNLEIAKKKLPFLSNRSKIVENKNPGPDETAFTHDKPQLTGERALYTTKWVDLLVSVTYKGEWDAHINGPPIASGIGTKGDYYLVTVEGDTELDGVTDWKLLEYALFNGTTWIRSNFPTTDTAIIRAGWSLDRKAGIVKFSQTAAMSNDFEILSNGWRAPTIQLKAAYKSNEGNESDFYRYEHTPVWNKPGGGTYPSNCGEWIVHVPELILYKIDGNAQNKDEIDAWALKRAEKEQFKFDNEILPKGKTYIGIVQESPNNGIMSVMWSINDGGATTDIQLGFDEPKRKTLRYKEKLSKLVNFNETSLAKNFRKKKDREVEDDTD